MAEASSSRTSKARTRGDASVSSDAFFGGIGRIKVHFTLIVFGALAALGVLALPLCRSRALTGLVVLALATLGAASLALASYGRGDGRSRPAYDVAMLVALVATLPVASLLDFGGPVAGFLALVLLLYGIEASPRASVALTAGVAGLHVTLAVLVALGVIPHEGLLDVVPRPASDASSAVSTAVLYLLVLSLVRVYRRRSAAHLEELAEAGREVAARGALLREARLELERVAAAGERGRFTEQRLGSFVLGPVLGVGGMGEVYEATHAESGAPAAVKLIRLEGADATDAIVRFEREAAIASRIRSPHVVRVLEVGGMEAPLPYIAMERLEGESLSRVLEREGRLSPERVVELVRQVGEGLSAAREHMVVHRDVKPSNLFATTEGTWKVLDFGLGRLAGDAGTLTGETMVGTLGYLSPEQLRPDAPVAHTTDVHALAIVAYRALTGRPAFVEREPSRVIREVESELPPRPSRLASVPPTVDDVLLLGLAKAPRDRFESARAFAEALAGAVRGELDAPVARRARELERKLSWSDAAASSKRAARGVVMAGAPAAESFGATKTLSVGHAAPSGDEGPKEAGGAPAAPPLEDRMTLVASPDALLRSMWLAPARSVTLVFALAALSSFSQIPLTPHPEMRPFGLFAVSLVFGELVLVRILSLDASERGVRRFNAAIVVTFASSTAFMYFFSIYSDTTAFAALALLLFGSGVSPRHTIAAALAVAIPHAAVHLGVSLGRLPDPGFYEVRAGLYARLLNLATTLSLYALAALLGVMFRRQQRRTLAELSDAFRKAAERDALLRDARLALERAFGVGREGRLTGQVLGGFELGVLLGRGGMGEVYEARRVSASAGEEPLAAVKVLGRRSSDGAVARFEREGRHVLAVDSPHVVRVLELGGAASALPFIAMERLFGSDLGDLLARRLSLGVTEVVEMARQIAEGLSAAHAKGIVHGDVTPRNVFRTEDGTWKLLDFGAAALGHEGARGGRGTPAYMAPEQIDDRAAIDARADVYGLAVVVYRALTGSPAFAGRDRAAVLYKVLHDAPSPPSTIAAVPREIDAVLERAMSKHPADRFPSARAFADALAAAAAGGVEDETRQVRPRQE